MTDTLPTRFQRLRKRLREAFRPPRRLSLLRPGGVLILGIFALGFATLNTGNNVLYLLLGALLGLIALSGWLSEQTLQRNVVTRIIPASVTAGHDARIEYRIINNKRRLPTVALEVRDTDVAKATFTEAFIPIVESGEQGAGISRARFETRGVYALHQITAATSYPFGLFRKERDLNVPGMIVVWPRTDREVRLPRPAGRRGAHASAGGGSAAGAERGDFRALRPYRPGDDPRDVHWRSTARRGEPIMREYDRDTADAYWIVLDTVSQSEVLFEVAIETAASLIMRAAERGERVGCAIGTTRIAPGSDGSGVDAALIALARVERAEQGAVQLPAQPSECVLVTTRVAVDVDYADVFTVAGDVVRTDSSSNE